MKLKISLLLLFSLIVFSCSQTDDLPAQQPNLQSGVVLTFDDDFVDEWFDVNTILEPYDWKATFFVTRFNQLSANKIQKLKDLKSYGHEIGGHGLNHLNAPTFISANGTNEYLNQEIFPMISLMNNNDLAATSFAYPYGARNSSTDNLMLDQFQIIRGTTYGNQIPALQNCFYNDDRVVFGLGIDKNYSHFSIPYFLSLLEYAKNNHKIVIFYAHKPVTTFQNNYETEYQTLIEICNYVKSNNMKFYKISELYNLQNSF
ncbi:polysaccharide deacetylase family protein [Flavobacterium sp.]